MRRDGDGDIGIQPRSSCVPAPPRACKIVQPLFSLKKRHATKNTLILPYENTKGPTTTPSPGSDVNAKARRKKSKLREDMDQADKW